MQKDFSLSALSSPSDKCVVAKGHERRQVFDEEQDRTVYYGCWLYFFLCVCDIAGCKNKSLFHPHLHMPAFQHVLPGDNYLLLTVRYRRALTT